MHYVFRLVLTISVSLAAVHGYKYLTRPAPSSPPPSAAPAPVVPASKPVDAVGPAPEPAFPVGVARRGDVVLVQMSDGTRRYQLRHRPAVSDGISQVTPSAVVIEGDKMFIKPKPRPAPVSSTPAPLSVVDAPADGVKI